MSVTIRRIPEFKSFEESGPCRVDRCRIFFPTLVVFVQKIGVPIVQIRCSHIFALQRAESLKSKRLSRVPKRILPKNWAVPTTPRPTPGMPVAPGTRPFLALTPLQLLNLLITDYW